MSRYTFFEAFPLSIAGSPVNYESGSVLKLNVTIAYTRFIMDDVTRTMKRAGRTGLSDSGDVGNLDDDTTNIYDLEQKPQPQPRVVGGQGNRPIIGNPNRRRGE